jgi:hypothetical protein
VVTLLEVTQKILPDGVFMQRAVWLIFGHVVQIVRYDGDNNSVVACVGKRVKQMPISKVGKWIRERI